MSQKMNIMDNLSNSNLKSTFNNSNLIFNPIIGGRTNDSIEDYHGLLVTSSKNQVNFYVLTPHQYFLIFTISTRIGSIHPLIAKTVFEEENDIKKQGIRKILFQDNELINFNVGVKSNNKEVIGDITYFELNVNKEIFCFGDSIGNLAIYKFHKHHMNESNDKDKIITIDNHTSAEENEMTYTSFLCYKIVKLSKNRVVYIKFFEIGNDICIIAVDFMNKLFIYSLEKEEIVFFYQIEYSYSILKNIQNKSKCFSIIATNNKNILSKDEVQSSFYYFKDDLRIIEFKLNKINSLDKIDCEAKEGFIKFKSKEFDSERTSIKKIICLDDYLNRSKENEYSDSNLISISYEKFLSIVNLKNRTEISYICFNHFIISHNINLFKNETYISVLDCENNFILFSVLPELKICFNIKISLPLDNIIIDNFFMSLDGHMILTTKWNEFYQAWLTFSDDDEIKEFDFDIIYDCSRLNQVVDKEVKLKKKSIFKTPTIESEYTELIKLSNSKPKLPSEIDPLKEICKSERALRTRLTIKTIFETEGNEYI